MSTDSETSSSADGSAALIARNLSCQRGESTLFQGLDLSLKPSTCVHVVGANGSGKTSLLRILCGLAEPASGTVQWYNQPTIANPAYCQEMAFIGHKDGLKNELSALENLRFYQQLETELDEDKLDDALEKLNILHCADLLAQGLSFGQRRRLAFARLLLSRKMLWILDEPFTGIDTDGRELMQRLCVEHLQAGGMIVLTHHQNLDNGPLSAYRSVFDLSQFRVQG